MKCLDCGAKMNVTKEPHSYKESGLDYVTIVADIARCPKCGASAVGLPAPVDELHKTIAKLIAKPSRTLGGPEIKFIRKYLGFSSGDFADFIGVTAPTLSRWEHGSAVPGPAYEKLIRLLPYNCEPLKEYPVKGSKAGKRPTSDERIQLKAVRGSWEQAA